MKKQFIGLYTACLDFKMAAVMGQANGFIDNWFDNFHETTNELIEKNEAHEIWNLNNAMLTLLANIEEKETQTDLDKLSKISDLMIELIKEL